MTAARKFQHQTRHGDASGNCYETCLANLVGCPIEEVPDRGQYPPELDPDGRLWEKALRTWLAARGLSEFRLPLDAFYYYDLDVDISSGTLLIGVGWPPGERTSKHAVLYRTERVTDENGDINIVFEDEHDPHEGGSGLEELLELVFLVHRGPTPTSPGDTE